jgi:hypothetical protein
MTSKECADKECADKECFTPRTLANALTQQDYFKMLFNLDIVDHFVVRADFLSRCAT